LRVLANGKAVELPDGAHLTDLLEAVGLGARWVVAEVNGEAVDRARMSLFALHDGDRVEMVRAVAGGCGG
jgi:sulfur carrier protein